MTEEERRIRAREILRTKSQDEVFGDFKDVVDGTYDIVIDKVYSSTNANGKEFIGIKSIIESGDYVGDFFIDCIYFNDDAFERGIQRIRNVLLEFGLGDITEEDVSNDNYLSRLSEIKGKRAKVIVKSNGDLNSYEYRIR